MLLTGGPPISLIEFERNRRSIKPFSAAYRKSIDFVWTKWPAGGGGLSFHPTPVTWYGNRRSTQHYCSNGSLCSYKVNRFRVSVSAVSQNSPLNVLVSRIALLYIAVSQTHYWICGSRSNLAPNNIYIYIYYNASQIVSLFKMPVSQNSPMNM